MFAATRCGVMTLKAPPKNYATFNPSDKGSGAVLSNGNLTLQSTTGHHAARATQGKSTGKWTFEMSPDGIDYTVMGFCNASPGLTSWVLAISLSGGLYGDNGSLANVNGTGTTFVAHSTSLVSNRKYLFAVDAGAGKCWIKANGSWISGNPEAGTNPSLTWTPTTIYPVASSYSGSRLVTANFGASAFVNDVPSGFNAGWYTEA